MTHDNLDPEALEAALTAWRESYAQGMSTRVPAAIDAYLAHIRARSLSDLAAADAVLLDQEQSP